MTIHVERHPDTWVFELSRPETRNALSAQLVEQLLSGLEHARAAGVRVLVLRGAGRSFSGGFDLSGLDAASDADLLQRFVRLETVRAAIENHPALTIGFAQGANVGAGVDLWAACRLRVADPVATFRVPGIGFEIVLGTRRFVRLLGEDAAHRFIAHGERLGAAAALAGGLATAVAPVSEWPEILATTQRCDARLTARAARMLREAVSEADADRDLAQLTRSASAPGLKQRIQRYVEASGRTAGAKP